MEVEIRVGSEFLIQFKRLSKKYRSLKSDIKDLKDSLVINPYQGTSLGKGVRKVRMAIASKGKGKSGGARLFQVDSEYVDWKMRLISTAIGAFSGSTIGSVVDIVNEVVAGITGVDFVSNLACGIYNAVSSDEDYNKLKEEHAESDARIAAFYDSLNYKGD